MTLFEDIELIALSEFPDWFPDYSTDSRPLYVFSDEFAADKERFVSLFDLVEHDLYRRAGLYTPKKVTNDLET